MAVRTLGLLMVLLACALPVSAATYYIATTGSDGNAGTEGSPWATFAPVLVAGLNPGDTVYFRQGTYSTCVGPVSLTNVQGTASQKITISSAPGELATFDLYMNGSFQCEWFSLYNVKHVVFQNFRLQNSWPFIDTYWQISNGSQPFSTQLCSAFDGVGGLWADPNTSDITFRNLRLHRAEFGSKYNPRMIYEDNHITEPFLGLQPFYVVGADNIIRNNIVEGSRAIGIRVGNFTGYPVDNVIIDSNVIKNSVPTPNGEWQYLGGSCCQWIPGNPSTDHCGWIVKPQGHGIFVFTGSDSDNMRITNNVVDRSYRDGIIVGDGSSLVAHNTIYGSGDNAIHLSGSSNTAVARNNLAYGTVSRGGQGPTGNNNIGQFAFFNQTNVTPNCCSPGNDPLFTGLAGGDFTLLAGSPAIGSGTAATLSAVPLDILGNARDDPPSMGAYEGAGGAGSGNTYSVVRNPATVQAGQNITASWSTTPGPAQVLDWIALQVASRAPAPNDYITNDGAGNQAWRYIGDGVTTAPLTGNFTVAAPLQEGSYRFWYCLNDGFNCPVSTDIFTVTTPPSADGFVVTRAAWHPANVPLGTRWINGIGGMASVRPGGTLRYVASIACVGCDVPTPVTDFFPLQCQVGVGGTWARLFDCGSPPPDTVTLAWDASVSEGVTGYNLYRCVGVGCQPLFLRDVGNTLTTVEPGLSPGHYRWAVTAYYATGVESVLSNVSEVVIEPSSFPVCLGTDTQVSMGGVSTRRLPLEPGFTGINGVVVAAPVNESFTVSPVDSQQFDMEYVVKFDKTISLQNVRCRPIRSNNMELDNVLSNPSVMMSTGKTRLFGTIGGGTFR